MVGSIVENIGVLISIINPIVMKFSAVNTMRNICKFIDSNPTYFDMMTSRRRKKRWCFKLVLKMQESHLKPLV